MRPSRALASLLVLLVLGSACSPRLAATEPTMQPTPGGVVFTPSPAPSTDAPGPTGTAAPLPSTEGPAGTYTVHRGDTLSSIARAFGTTAQQLQDWNVERYPSLAADPNVIEPGWALAIAAANGPGATVAPTPSSASLAPAPSPIDAGCSAGNLVAAGSPQTFRTIPDAGPGVALTFDMGGRMEPAVDILNFLVANRVCASIFATGAMSRTADGEAALAIVRDHPELFEMGNHTMYHCDLVRGGGGSPRKAPCAGDAPSADRIQREFAEAEEIIRAATGQDPQPYWRPPYGSINAEVIGAAAAAGYTLTFLWDIDTADWRPIAEGGPTAEQIAAKVITSAVNGSNVLFHLGGYETLDALRLIVPAMRDRGFTLTSLSDLLD